MKSSGKVYKQGKIQSITGFGKFKTSSAFGTALRAIDQDWKVLIVQFLKGAETGEINIMRKYFSKNVKIMRYGADKIVLPNNIETFDKEETQRGWQEMLDERELEKYNRQIIISNFGIEGQEKLKYSRVCVIGLGGLGSGIVYYMD